jgi:hypothetical protein
MAEATLTIIDPAAEVSAQPTATPEPQPVEVPAVVTLPYKDGSINVRAMDNTDSAIVTSLKHEDKITVIEDIENAEIAAQLVKNTIKTGDAVLFKASRAVAIERIIRLL